MIIVTATTYTLYFVLDPFLSALHILPDAVHKQTLIGAIITLITGRSQLSCHTRSQKPHRLQFGLQQPEDPVLLTTLTSTGSVLHHPPTPTPQFADLTPTIPNQKQFTELDMLSLSLYKLFSFPHGFPFLNPHLLWGIFSIHEDFFKNLI